MHRALEQKEQRTEVTGVTIWLLIVSEARKLGERKRLTRRIFRSKKHE
jgi:hypothetical protein